MKLALITDTHFGARGDNPAFNEFFFKFWENTFFPYLQENNITTVVHLGDVVDRRRFINFTTLHNLRKRFVSRLKEMNIDFHVIVGNHDVPYRNTNEVNAMEELFSLQDNLKIYSAPKTVTFDGTDISLIPWINHTNMNEILEYIKQSPAQICFGHFEIAGFEMDRGNVCHEGLSREMFDKFDIVYSGHFHHKSTDGHVTYLGNTYEMTWADYNDKRGFHIFDTTTRELDFIENPYRMFHKVLYDEKQETLETVANKNYEQYKNAIVKVIVASKSNPVLYDMFLDNLYKVTPLDLTIVEDFTDYSEISDDDIVDQSDDTVTLLDKYIDGIEIDLDKTKLKNQIREIYLEAQNLETK
jgi:DNA repair exonuclease SbcCD nuclease subunit